jgi:hypothetical protein
MRFIVDLFRNILIGMCAVVVIAAALLVFAAVDHSGPLGAQLTGTIVLIALSALTLLVLNIGGIAILISIHDRHVEIADNTGSMANALASLALSCSQSARDVA